MKQIHKLVSKKILSLLLIISFVAFGCSDSGMGKAQPVELLVWKPFVDSESMRSLIDAYQELHRNVRITYVQPDGTDYETELLNALAAGNGPDIFSINNAWLPQYIDKVTEAPESQWRYVDYKNDFVDTVTTDFTRDNKIYGAAMSVDALALYYNKSMLSSNGIYTSPKTWQQLSQAVRAIAAQDSGGYFRQSGISLGLSSQTQGGQINRAEDILYMFMLQQGATSWSSDLSEPEFAEEVEKNGNQINPAEEALEFYTSFADPGDDNYNWNTRSDYSLDAFVNRRSAMMINYSYARDTIKQKNAALDFDVAPVPQPTLNGTAINFANYWGEVVSKQSKNSAVAWDFLKFITSKDQLSQYYVTSKVPSSRKDLVAEQTSDPEIGVFAHAGASARSFTRPQAAKVDAIFARMIDAVTLKGLEPEEAVDEAVQQASTLSRSE